MKYDHHINILRSSQKTLGNLADPEVWVFEVVTVFVTPAPLSFAVHVYDLTKPLKQITKKKKIAFNVLNVGEGIHM